MCSVIYKLLDTLSTRLVASAPKVEERVSTGELEVAATFHASVKKSISATGKVKIAGCKVRAHVLQAASGTNCLPARPIFSALLHPPFGQLCMKAHSPYMGWPLLYLLCIEPCLGFASRFSASALHCVAVLCDLRLHSLLLLTATGAGA